MIAFEREVILSSTCSIFMFQVNESASTKTGTAPILSKGAKHEMIVKVGKITSIILPTEANTSSSNEKFNALWLSPDEWMIYFDGKDTNNVIHNLFNEISKLNFGAITEISDHWVCFNICLLYTSDAADE